MTRDLLHKLLTIPSPSGHEQELADFIVGHARALGCVTAMDEHRNVYIRKGQPGKVPCISAHLDTVVPVKPKVINQNGRIYGVDEQGQRTGIGADDKTGVYVCLRLLEQVDDLIVILFAGEEIGGIGARNVSPDWFKDVGYLIEFDCPGSGLVSYTSGGVRLFANGGEFIRCAAPVMREQGLTQWQHHPFSDVMILRQRFPISCLNISSGYHRWHQRDEFIDTAELGKAVETGKALIQALGCRAYPFAVEANDEVQPLFAVTGLQVTEPALPLVVPPKASPTNAEPADLTEEYISDSLWERFAPREIPFFKMNLMDRLNHKPYHAVLIFGPFQREELVKAYSKSLYRSETTLICKRKSVIRMLFHFGNDAYGYFEDEWFTVYAPSRTAAMKIADGLRGFRKLDAEEHPHFFILSLPEGHPQAQKVEIKRPLSASLNDLHLHYGDDFMAWEQGWLKRLQNSASGLTILLGPPGCGKTSYLRTLMARLLNEAVFYFVPIDTIEVLSSPRFVDFWIKQAEKHGDRRKIAIVEDAEDILLPRDGASTAKVSNLLNIADGFLGDHLRLHVIATTNAAVTELDKAVIRPGRLTGCREFRRLPRQQAERIAAAKGFTLAEERSDYSLAEIYCGAGESVQIKKTVGFAS